ncbi:MAG TPA: cell division protein FtsZ [Elusimicrobiales bacterium]|nr:cell division protein FtsZ [Elusimicrobiales bacterium]HOL61983.1 cell division protein FtsZ [Elusimicrobiales bacterium]HPO94515.1 cell division protein FtsZ [Elusimicrobiales bacterium]
MPDLDSYDLKEAVIKIIGVGGAGGNTINNIVAHLEKNATVVSSDDTKKFRNIDVIAANTDIQVLRRNKAPIRIPLGEQLTRGLGAGGNPEVGKKAALESLKDIEMSIKGADLLIVTGGMGGGTGTGAIPIIAETAKNMGILVMAVVTKPFKDEGEFKSRLAEDGIKELRKHVDAIITIPNDRILTLSPDLTNKEGYKEVDNVLIEAITGITDIITTAGTVNVDFADISSILKQSGTALVGIGKGKGDKRNMDAIKKAINFPLIEGADIHNSKGLIVYFKSPDNFKVKEKQEIMDYIQKKVSNQSVKFKYGEHFDNSIPEDELWITLIATGFGYCEEPSTPKRAHLNETREFAKSSAKDIENFYSAENRNKPAYLRRKTSFLD